MATTCSHPLPATRAASPRLGHVALELGPHVVCTLERWHLRWQASRLRAAELRALRDLSPKVLRDIGAAPEWINHAQRWCDQHDATRDTFLRSL